MEGVCDTVQERLRQCGDDRGSAIIVTGNLATGAQSSSTPSKEDFDAWLAEHPLAHPMSKEAVYAFLDRAPISLETKDYIKKKLHVVPNPSAHLDMLTTSPQGSFTRLDFRELLIKLGRQGVKAVLMPGRRRIGKTVALPHEAVAAREEVLGWRDKVVFYHEGYPDIPFSHLYTIMRLLAHMNILALFDEFQELTNGNIAKYYKIFLEENHIVSALSAVLYGSNEAMVWDKGAATFSGLLARGAVIERLPLPPVSLMAAMLREREPALQGSGLGLRLLRKVTLFGHDLSLHMEGGSEVETLEKLKSSGLQAACHLSGERLRALQQLMAGCNKATGIAGVYLSELTADHYIVRRSTSKDYYDFMDPRLVALQAANTAASLEDVEGKVLEYLIRQPLHLLPALLEVLGFQLSHGQIKELHVYHGNVTKSAELDSLFMLPGAAVVVSAKRSQGAQHWQESFTDHLDAMWREWKQVPSQVAQSFAADTSLHLVAVSVGEGNIRGMQPSMYGEGRAGFPPKQGNSRSMQVAA
ncbi:hypothetical protein WJX72_010018 [[Myrmecia] bisecta]|uniref:Uncharacterized protein n=1 Tax=[Myrmecia] bisecta TaxID=41462 RepID=A0AAW1R9P8_9CHLO